MRNPPPRDSSSSSPNHTIGSPASVVPESPSQATLTSVTFFEAPQTTAGHHPSTPHSNLSSTAPDYRPASSNLPLQSNPSIIVTGSFESLTSERKGISTSLPRQGRACVSINQEPDPVSHCHLHAPLPPAPASPQQCPPQDPPRGALTPLEPPQALAQDPTQATTFPMRLSHIPCPAVLRGIKVAAAGPGSSSFDYLAHRLYL